MAPASPQSRPSPVLRRILDAALVIFGRYGFRRASMEEVAGEAGLSRQGLYRHFATKEALFVAVVEDVHRATEAAAAAAADTERSKGGDAASVLAAMIAGRFEAYLANVHSSPHAAELTEESNRLGGAVAQEGVRIFRDMMIAAIEGERRRKQLKLKPGFNAGSLADLLITAANGVKHAVPTPTLPEMKKSVSALTAVIVAGASG